jgi:hypothetical protein
MRISRLASFAHRYPGPVKPTIATQAVGNFPARQILPRTMERLLEPQHRREQDVQVAGLDFLHSPGMKGHHFGQFFLGELVGLLAESITRRRRKYAVAARERKGAKRASSMAGLTSVRRRQKLAISKPFTLLATHRPVCGEYSAGSLSSSLKEPPIPMIPMGIPVGLKGTDTTFLATCLITLIRPSPSPSWWFRTPCAKRLPPP